MKSLLPKHSLISLASFAFGGSMLFAAACEEYTPPASGTGGTAMTGGVATGGGSSGGAGNGTGGAGLPSGGAQTGDVCTATGPVTVPLVEANNLKFQSTMSIAETTVAPGLGDVVIDWSGVTTDMFKRPLDQSTLTAVVAVIWSGITLPEIAEAINAGNDALLSAKPLLFAYVPTQGGTVKSAKLADFQTPGNTRVGDEASFADTIADGAPYVFTVMLQNGKLNPQSGLPNAGFDVLMLQGFHFQAGGGTTVTVTDTSTDLNFTADLHTPAPLALPAGKTDITLDWTSSLTKTSYGSEFVYNQVTEILIGRYDPSVDLEKDFVDIRTIAKDLWELKAFLPSTDVNPEFTNGSAVLSKLKNAGGTAFPGIEAGTTDQYVFALVCGPDSSQGCRNPTPWYVTRLNACP